MLIRKNYFYKSYHNIFLCRISPLLLMSRYSDRRNFVPNWWPCLQSFRRNWWYKNLRHTSVDKVPALQEVTCYKMTIECEYCAVPSLLVMTTCVQSLLKALVTMLHFYVAIVITLKNNLRTIYCLQDMDWNIHLFFVHNIRIINLSTCNLRCCVCTKNNI